MFLVMAVLFGIGMGTIDGFMFLYLKQLGESKLNSNSSTVPRHGRALQHWHGHH